MRVDPLAHPPVLLLRLSLPSATAHAGWRPCVPCRGCCAARCAWCLPQRRCAAHPRRTSPQTPQRTPRWTRRTAAARRTTCCRAAATWSRCYTGRSVRTEPRSALLLLACTPTACRARHVLTHCSSVRPATTENADPAELQRLAAAAESADASRELPAGGPGGAAARAWTAEELREKRTKVQEVRDPLRSAARRTRLKPRRAHARTRTCCTCLL
jgi:hypothetical protein